MALEIIELARELLASNGYRCSRIGRGPVTLYNSPWAKPKNGVWGNVYWTPLSFEGKSFALKFKRAAYKFSAPIGAAYLYMYRERHDHPEYLKFEMAHPDSCEKLLAVVSGLKELHGEWILVERKKGDLYESVQRQSKTEPRKES